MIKNWKLVFVFAVFVFFSENALAVSLDIGESYNQKETIIGKLSGSILQNIKKEQVKLLRDHVPVAFEYDIKNIGGDHYIWLIAPQNQNNYTLVIEDIFEDTLNGPQVVDYQKSFLVNAELVDYNINPGFIFTANDFEIEARVFSGSDKQISVDFPEPKSLILKPGTNSVDFSIESVNGAQFKMISLGDYKIPAYILGQDSSVCGDNIIEDDEVCECGVDGICGNSDDKLFGNSCVIKNFESGNLTCSMDCLSFNTEQCVIGEENTGDSDGNESSENNRSESDESEGGGDGNSERFRIDPGLIRSTVLFSQEEIIYQFKIFNSGNETISDLIFDYDRNRFLITPEEDFDIEANESMEFELKVLNPDKGRVRGVIIADSEFESEYLLVSISFTDEEGEVSTEYIRENTGESSNYYCSELSGVICSGEEICGGDEISSLDGLCCLSSCQNPGSAGGKTWVGLLIAAIIITILGVIYFRYKKAGTGASRGPLQSRVSSIERNVP